MKDYRIVAYPITHTRTGQEWNPISVTSTVYRIEGPGVDRTATDIEIAVYHQGKHETDRDYAGAQRGLDPRIKR